MVLTSYQRAKKELKLSYQAAISLLKETETKRQKQWSENIFCYLVMKGRNIHF